MSSSVSSGLELRPPAAARPAGLVPAADAEDQLLAHAVAAEVHGGLRQQVHGVPHLVRDVVAAAEGAVEDDLHVRRAVTPDGLDALGGEREAAEVVEARRVEGVLHVALDGVAGGSAESAGR
jgi:hypothetical protein